MSNKKQMMILFLLIIVCGCIIISGKKIRLNGYEKESLNINNRTTKHEEDILIEPDDFFLVAAIGNDMAQRVDTVYIKDGECFTIYPVIQYGDMFYSNVDKININGTSYNTVPVENIMNVQLYQVNPVMKGYDNFEGIPSREFKSYIMPIDYEFESMTIKSISNEQIEKGYGTYYFGINLDTFLVQNNGVFTTTLFIHKEYEEKIVQVVYREDDTYIGILKELMNTPFVYVPKFSRGYHQTDERIGSDCAEFVIYGMRRMGYKIPYCGPNNIHKYAEEIVSGKVYLDRSSTSGVYKDESLNLIKINEEEVQPGDIIHFGEQVSVFYEDKGIIGVLDVGDLIIQSYYNEPEIVSIEDSGFYGYPLKIYRFITDL